MTQEIKDFCKRFNITEDQFYGREEIKGDLNLRWSNLTSLPENFNPTVGGDLRLEYNQLTSLPENFNPTVGGGLITDFGRKHVGAKVSIPKIQLPEIYTWNNGQYIKADGIFMEVVSKKGNIYKVRKINKIEESYLITDGNGRWSHGSTLKEAKDDLIYKISNRDKSSYKDLAIDSELTFEECVEMYRVITGACSFGTRNFVENRLKERKEKYKILEVIEITKGEYNSSLLENFFKKIS